jgi:hypothetical protein
VPETICSRPIPAVPCPRGLGRVRHRRHIVGSFCLFCRGLFIAISALAWYAWQEDIRSSAAWRVCLGAGLERPEPVGEKTCRLAVGSADMLFLADGDVSVYRRQTAGHAAPGGGGGGGAERVV